MKNINIKKRKLNVSWTNEMISDLNSFHGIDAQKELERILINELRVSKRKEKIKKIFEKN